MKEYKNVDEYVATFPEGTQILLEQLREIVLTTAPDVEERISYGMPSYKWHGVLVYFGAYAKHIGFYPTGSGIAAFQAELATYKCSKGTIQLPLNQALPLDLLTRIVQFRIKENEEKMKEKSKS
jgi:uncharacterized protein YdhG (YjbR/CyaY superfamily)